MKKIWKFGFLTILSSAFIFSGCESYPEEDDYVAEQLVTVTNYDTNVNFKDAKYKNFFIADTVTLVKNGSVDRVLVASDPKWVALSNRVTANLTATGYTASNKNNADMGITLSIIQSTNVTVAYPWWWSYVCVWDFWDCGYYPPYYPYPYPVVIGGYTVGTLAMDMIDLTSVQNSTRKSMWSGVVRGLDTGHTAEEIGNAIDQCFTQTVPFQK